MGALHANQSRSFFCQLRADATASKIWQCFSLADKVVKVAGTAAGLGAGERLTIVASDFYGSYLFQSGQSGHKVKETFKDPREVLTEALHWLKAHPRRKRLRQTKTKPKGSAARQC